MACLILQHLLKARISKKNALPAEFQATKFHCRKKRIGKAMEKLTVQKKALGSDKKWLGFDKKSP